MKGKKIDNVFLSQFISNCVENKIFLSEEIVKLAKNKINFIDQKIKEVEEMKILRSKLLDVISSFDDSIKNVGQGNKILPFYSIQHQDLARFICKSIKKRTTNINSLVHDKYHKDDIMFCIKQLLENKIISRTDDNLISGEMFNNYCQLFLKEE